MTQYCLAFFVRAFSVDIDLDLFMHSRFIQRLVVGKRPKISAVAAAAAAATPNPAAINQSYHNLRRP